MTYLQYLATLLLDAIDLMVLVGVGLHSTSAIISLQQDNQNTNTLNMR